MWTERIAGAKNRSLRVSNRQGTAEEKRPTMEPSNMQSDG